ncbi:membrane protein insertase YidC [Novosphingobium sp.]|uniref:membrane protein insertase YidC n=1 Tax=Novosphingobium sp. TaxID=1874826 RepID=UPI0025DF356E|nr:membrane protein insertase YidC [Novosphingobium sp.]
MQNQRNLIWAAVLTGLLLLAWDAGTRWFYPNAGKAKTVAASAPSANATTAAKLTPTREGGLTTPEEIAQEAKSLPVALSGPRVAIDAPRVKGSIALTGGMVDDLTLNDHRETTDKNSPPVRILSPAGTPAQHFAQFGWVGEGVAAPDAKTVWQADGAKLTPQTPITLKWTNPTGQTYSIRYAIDDAYMLTAAASVQNAGALPVVLRPFALISRTDRTASVSQWNLHSGPIGAFAATVDFGNNYDTVLKAPGGTISPTAATDWIGFTDIYWMSTLIPEAAGGAQGDFRSLGSSLFRADVLYKPQSVAPGQTLTRTTKLFAGAKENATLERYEKAGVTNFSLAIDWGWFRWFEKPIFYLLDFLFKTVGNFGVAIMLLTVVVRGLMFPIAQRQFASMAAMRSIQPKMKAIQERFKDDKQTQQQEIMKLYKEEKVNPLAGCLPLLLQFPVFIALYKVLMLTIEMRHQPFVLWIKDLSAPDPAHFLNLFGLLPYNPPAMLGIGVLALLLGVTMWGQFKLQPSAMDPAQQQMMSLMPWVMMFVMAPYAAGLLLYWITSNLLTILQQQYLYSRHPVLKAQANKDQLDIDRVAARDTKK